MWVPCRLLRTMEHMELALERTIGTILLGVFDVELSLNLLPLSWVERQDIR
jgi:hypothetical protein